MAFAAQGVFSGIVFPLGVHRMFIAVAPLPALGCGRVRGLHTFHFMFHFSALDHTRLSPGNHFVLDGIQQNQALVVKGDRCGDVARSSPPKI